MKNCATCQTPKDVSEFPSTGYSKRVDGSKRQIFKPDCKLCHNLKVSSRFFDMLENIGIVFKCKRCGYDDCRSAIDFHHLDPNEKDFNIGNRRSVNVETLRAEINKCIVLCKRCHCELHVGFWQLTELGD